MDDIRKHTEEDHELQELIKVILTGWPEYKSQVPHSAVPYYIVRNELTVQNGVIFRGERVVTPKSLRRDMLQRIHASHLGIDGCQRHARECLYWPRMSSEVKDYVQQFDVCRSTDSMQQKEPLQPHDVPSRPWAKVTVDLSPTKLSQIMAHNLLPRSFSASANLAVSAKLNISSLP